MKATIIDSNKREDLEGLRALAVLLVVLYHADVEVFAGGFVGVDVFFVISGFLIINIILKGLYKGSFSYTEFLCRRAKRILPPLLVVCTFVLSVYLVIGFEYEVVLTSESIISIFSFLSNIYFWREQDYFSPEADSYPLIHSWSLSLEEQFYFIFPICLYMGFRFFRNHIVSLYVVVLITFFLIMVILSQRYPVAAFYLLPTRMWEFLIGGFLALGTVFNLKIPSHFQISGRTVALINAAGYALIVIGMLVAPGISSSSLLYTVPVCVGTFLVILFRTRVPILHSRTMLWLGGISYSFYLWHQPLIAMTKSLFPTSDIGWLLVIPGMLAIVPAYLSTKYIEFPIISSSSAPRFVLPSAIALCCIMVGVSFLSLSAAQSLFTLSNPEVSTILDRANDNNPRMRECRAEYGRAIAIDNSCIYGSASTDKMIAIWGDSHVNQLAPALGEYLEMSDLALLELSYAGCPPILGTYRSDRNYIPCDARNREVVDFLAGRHGISKVILHSHWIGYFDMGRLEVIEGTLSDRKLDLIAALVATIDVLRQNSISVILLGPVPTLPEDPVMSAAKRYRVKSMFGMDVTEEMFSYRQYLESSALARSILQEIADDYDVPLLSFADVMCDQPEGLCQKELGGVWLYRDTNHLSNSGARALLNFGLFDENLD